MRNLLGFLAVLIILGSMIAVASDQPQDEAQGQMPEMGPPQQIQDMAFIVGDWTYKGRLRMDENSPWQENEAKVTFSYVAGGGAIQMEYTGMMMGTELNGVGLTAYDRELEQWQETWVDNFSGRISYYTGKPEDGRRVVSGMDYMGGQVFYSRATTYDFTDTEFKWMMENSIDGDNWFISMEGVYTKNK